MSGNLLYWCSFLQAIVGIPFTNHDFIRWDQSIYAYVCSMFVQIFYAVHLVVQSNHLTQIWFYVHINIYIYVYISYIHKRFCFLLRDFNQIRNIKDSRIVNDQATKLPGVPGGRP